MWQTQHRLEVARFRRYAALWTRPDRSGIESGIRAGLVAVVLTGIGWCETAAAAVCRVPAAVLCKGCVQRLSIRIAAGGACRISFTSAAPNEQTGAVTFVDIDIDTESHRPRLHRVTAPPLSAGEHAVTSRASGRCFVFNGRRFCE
jgi:hypothetical protein